MTHASPMSAVANDDIEILLPVEVDTNRVLVALAAAARSRFGAADDGDHRAAAGRRGVALRLRQPDRLDRRGCVDRVHLGGDDRRRHRDASQRAPAADAVPRHAAGRHARLRACVCAGGGRGLPGRAGASGLRVRAGGVVHHARRRWSIPNTFRVAAIAFGVVAMLAIVLRLRGAHGVEAASGRSPRCWWRRWPRCAAGCRRSWRSWAC